jgi:hypothetical protein
MFFKKAPPQPATQSGPSGLTDWGQVFAQRHAELLDRVAKLTDTVADLRERVALQEKGLKALEMEWQEWWDKFRTLYARLAKRVKDAHQLETPENDSPQSREDAPERTIPPLPIPGARRW